MELIYSKGSAFARKVRILAHEIGVSDRIALKLLDARDDAAELEARNPLGKLPVLSLEDGTRIFDSAVICEYLEDRFGDGRLIPRTSGERWQALTLAALGDGLIEAGMLYRVEQRRGDVQPNSPWAQLQMRKVRTGLAHADRLAPGFADRFHIGHVAIACAVGWLEFRLGDERLLATCPDLASWFAAAGRRPSLAMTVPSE